MSNKTKPNRISNKITPITPVQLQIREFEKRIQRLKSGMRVIRRDTSLKFS